ncbi:MAG TPA: type II toxin-antitoxin system mRNA interferase toxin, RelE/StbE family [Spirochaetota bacterium]|nr:type II toxin-antitoxin system mRNA interferase toxin, RelE/StbE family [Spirochaetota bacterium]HOS32736.1 type II toxin-antitoxin system mRNA interferase toxin, RelE/StbE family [Spirochaetota bacterium]HOS54608.1 type II toxin-antitoxin system mRNA interferase toxin, RelE/StbE family [Spirochaetota bacterium]HPK61604.1 type II toxin-antitoxin system mRNA interferase toxin, RelE/StbE family [Spirochaetota bacterium]HQF77106.1 type II toxin-antitoxin system mRNA interferase toxin, RelE/StbE
MKIVLSDYFQKKIKKFLTKRPELAQRYKDVLNILLVDHNNSSLRLHKLKGNLKNFWAISLNYKYRIILLIENKEDTIYLLDIGTHDEAY